MAFSLARRALARTVAATPRGIARRAAGGELAAALGARAASSRCAAVPILAKALPVWTRPLAAAQPSRRWYSAGRSGAQAGDHGQVPPSRLWSFEEVKRLVQDNKAADGGEDGPKNVVIVDVREPGELHATGKIPGAVNIPVTSAVQSFHVSDADFEDMHGFARPPRDATLLFYCKAGVRARSAATLAQHAGWPSVGEYPGSWLDWEVHGGPVEKA
ncbi:cytochrome P450 61 [Purpureocillium lavendulum]|uniref:Cytochrome P450 61 n=1 Tax=Purpureocillium lavendulum TaxID=1247861 RepID=A0AB34G055_9HYPO|nr:cytochrome P450 61 [Purpureocillium lavendulum]